MEPSGTFQNNSSLAGARNRMIMQVVCFEWTPRSGVVQTRPPSHRENDPTRAPFAGRALNRKPIIRPAPVRPNLPASRIGPAPHKCAKVVKIDQIPPPPTCNYVG